MLGSARADVATLHMQGTLSLAAVAAAALVRTTACLQDTPHHAVVLLEVSL